jgi:hypothetical protein
MMSNTSIKKPVGSEFESYCFSDEDGTRKSLVSRLESSAPPESALKNHAAMKRTGAQFAKVRESVDSAL